MPAAVVLQYVTECFSSSSLFHKALKEAFEAFCNKQVGGLASAELMANFCNTLLTKARRIVTYCPAASEHTPAVNYAIPSNAACARPCSRSNACGCSAEQGYLNVCALSLRSLALTHR